MPSIHFWFTKKWFACDNYIAVAFATIDLLHGHRFTFHRRYCRHRRRPCCCHHCCLKIGKWDCHYFHFGKYRFAPPTFYKVQYYLISLTFPAFAFPTTVVVVTFHRRYCCHRRRPCCCHHCCLKISKWDCHYFHFGKYRFAPPTFYKVEYYLISLTFPAFAFPTTVVVVTFHRCCPYCCHPFW